jgi:hypothetical protein
LRDAQRTLSTTEARAASQRHRRQPGKNVTLGGNYWILIADMAWLITNRWNSLVPSKLV